MAKPQTSRKYYERYAEHTMGFVHLNGQTVGGNRPNIIICNDNSREYQVIKWAPKNTKYRDLEIGLQK